MIKWYRARYIRRYILKDREGLVSGPPEVIRVIDGVAAVRTQEERIEIMWDALVRNHLIGERVLTSPVD